MLPAMDVSAALHACPFLKNVARRQGHEYARSIAVNPFVPAPAARRPILEEEDDFAETFLLFHGKANSPFPLPVHSLPVAAKCEKENLLGSLDEKQPEAKSEDQIPNGVDADLRSSMKQMPFASMSLGFGGMPDFGGLFRHIRQQKGKLNTGRKLRPDSKADARPAAAGSPQLGNPPSQAAASSAAGCPLRKMLGPFAGVVFSGAPLACPEPIMKARAVLASTSAIRTLRPKSLPTKLAAVGLTAATLNVPCGMWREHTKKFSVEWMLAVHATIPFIAMLRKAVIMPKYAIVFSILSAVAGQAIGARLERERLQREMVKPIAEPQVVACEDQLRTTSRRVSPLTRINRMRKRVSASLTHRRAAAPVPVAVC